MFSFVSLACFFLFGLVLVCLLLFLLLAALGYVLALLYLLCVPLHPPTFFYAFLFFSLFHAVEPSLKATTHGVVPCGRISLVSCVCFLLLSCFIDPLGVSST